MNKFEDKVEVKQDSLTVLKVYADGTVERVFDDAPKEEIKGFQKWKAKRTKKIEWDLE